MRAIAKDYVKNELFLEIYTHEKIKNFEMRNRKILLKDGNSLIKNSQNAIIALKF